MNPAVMGELFESNNQQVDRILGGEKGRVQLNEMVDIVVRIESTQQSTLGAGGAQMSNQLLQLGYGGSEKWIRDGDTMQCSSLQFIKYKVQIDRSNDLL
eukprot:scaffold335996_cov139-Cyclotella_meneghiniana.AAC.1